MTNEELDKLTIRVLDRSGMTPEEFGFMLETALHDYRHESREGKREIAAAKSRVRAIEEGGLLLLEEANRNARHIRRSARG